MKYLSILSSLHPFFNVVFFLDAFQSKLQREFPGFPVVRAPVFPLQGTQVQSLYGEIRFPKTHGIAKKKKKWRHQYIASLNTSACTSLRRA